MSTVISKDGTTIAYEKSGSGPALLLIDGELCYQEVGTNRELIAPLSASYTVYRYDRRGRGNSGNTLPYAVEREIEDIDALIQVAGGSVFAFGSSVGAVLALDAAAHLGSVRKLAVYDAPIMVDDTHPPRPDDYFARIDDLIAANKRGAAVKSFLRMMGEPGLAILLMQFAPTWSKLKSVAHTLPYDLRIMSDVMQGRPLTTRRWASVTVPTLVVNSTNSPTWMRNGMQALAQTLPSAHYRPLDLQPQQLMVNALPPVLQEFFK